MINNNIRIKTEPINDSDKYLQIKLDQSFDHLEILSLKLTQSNVYNLNSANYGSVVGRCYMNNGLGIPNVRVSIFIPLSDEDKLNPNVFEMYPYETLSTTDKEFQRYNILPNSSNGECHVPVGRFPTKNSILDNPELSDVYTKYYKFTTETNQAGDYMFFGVPVGIYTVIVDCDLSDIGIFSQRPYDMVEQGSSETMFDSMTQFKGDGNMNLMPQIISKRFSVSVNPFWGDIENNIIGISRLDIDLGYTIEPKAIFVGSIFGDNEKNSINKNCVPRKDLGEICDTVTSTGKIEMIRETLSGGIEIFNINGGDLIDDEGNWAYRIPMNLDYVVTNEIGELVPTEDTNKGIPTRTKVRFKVGMDETGGEGRIRTRAKFLIPHNPTNSNEVDYNFSNSTKPSSMRNMYWNKIYTVKQFIPRIQTGDGVKNKNNISIKNVDNCTGSKNPFPYNKFDNNRNPLFSVLCLLLSIIIIVVSAINEVLVFISRIPLVKNLACISFQCGDGYYYPGCRRGKNQKNSPVMGTNVESTHECYKRSMAEDLNVYKFNFHSDWVNGSLYSFLLKYKAKKGLTKFCDYDNSTNLPIRALNSTLKNQNLYIPFEGSHKEVKFGRGIVKKFTDGELYYVPYTTQTQKLFATDIYELGAVFDCDWQNIPKIHNLLLPTSYIIPPTMEESGVWVMAGDGKGRDGLLFDFTCIDFKMNERQVQNINRICEIGVGLDESRDYNNTPMDGVIDIKDIESKYVRDVLIYLNSSSAVNPNVNITSDFTGNQYKMYRDLTLNNNHNLGYHLGNSLYFYFGSIAGKSSLDLMNRKYFTPCLPNVDDEITIIGTVTNVSTIGGANGKINIEIDGGTSPYTFEWSNGAITQNIQNLTAGTYTVIVTDSMNISTSKIFSVTQPQPLDFDVVYSDALINGVNNGSITIQSIYGGIAPYTVTLSGGSSQTIPNIGVNGVTIQNLGAGNYSVKVTDANGISVTKSVTLSNPFNLSMSLTKVDNTCINGDEGEINIYMNSGNPPYIYSITSNDATMTEIINGVEVEVPYVSDSDIQVGLKKGTYIVNVRDNVSLGLEAIGSTDPRRYGITQNITIVDPPGSITLSKVRIGGKFVIIYNQSLNSSLDPSDFTLIVNNILNYSCESISYNSGTYIGYEFDSEPNNGSVFYLITDEGCESLKVTKNSND